MKSAKEIEQEQSGDNIKTRKIFENDNKYFQDIISQCNDENMVEILKDARRGKTERIRHYKLDNGIHVYKLMEDGNRKIHIIAPEEIENFDIGEEDVKTEVKGVWVTIAQNLRFRGETNIRYRVIDEGIFEHILINADNYEISSTIKDIPDNAQTMLDVINDRIDKYEYASDSEKTLAKSRFNKIYSGLDRDDLKVYNPVEIKIIQLESELKQAETEISKVKTENETLKEENETLTLENNKFKDALDKTREQMHRMRDFIIDRCAKIPFVGKRILKEMNKELGVNELDTSSEER